MSFMTDGKLKIAVFGESHGSAIGVTIDGLPAGVKLDDAFIKAEMARRAPGKSPYATPRKEADIPEILSGVLNGVTTGAPLCAIIRNTNTRSADYENVRLTPRPGHADYTAHVKYRGFEDIRGGGHFSGRLTAPLVFAGAVCKLYLAENGIHTGAHIERILTITATRFDPLGGDTAVFADLAAKAFPALDEKRGEQMKQAIADARGDLDSVGGCIEGMITGLPAGLGGPLFAGVEGRLSKLFFAIPAVKGVEFGDGFAFAHQRASQANDAFTVAEGQIRTKTNHAGGILGGITSGMPLIYRLAVKPTPSIAKEQDSVELISKTPAKLSIHGRHDPCILPRAVCVAEAMAAIGVADLLLEG